jgi:hypothetical protein
MTDKEAEELQAKWKLQGSLPCPHQTQKLGGRTAGGYLTGVYYCVECGEASFIPPPQD